MMPMNSRHAPGQWASRIARRVGHWHWHVGLVDVLAAVLFLILLDYDVLSWYVYVPYWDPGVPLFVAVAALYAVALLAMPLVPVPAYATLCLVATGVALCGGQTRLPSILAAFYALGALAWHRSTTLLWSCSAVVGCALYVNASGGFGQLGFPGFGPFGALYVFGGRVVGFVPYLLCAVAGVLTRNMVDAHRDAERSARQTASQRERLRLLAGVHGRISDELLQTIEECEALEACSATVRVLETRDSGVRGSDVQSVHARSSGLPDVQPHGLEPSLGSRPLGSQLLPAQGSGLRDVPSQGLSSHEWSSRGASDAERDGIAEIGRHVRFAFDVMAKEASPEHGASAAVAMGSRRGAGANGGVGEGTAGADAEDMAGAGIAETDCSITADAAAAAAAVANGPLHGSGSGRLGSSAGCWLADGGEQAEQRHASERGSADCTQNEINHMASAQRAAMGHALQSQQAGMGYALQPQHASDQSVTALPESFGSFECSERASSPLSSSPSSQCDFAAHLDDIGRTLALLGFTGRPLLIGRYENLPARYQSFLRTAFDELAINIAKHGAAGDYALCATIGVGAGAGLGGPSTVLSLVSSNACRAVSAVPIAQGAITSQEYEPARADIDMAALSSGSGLGLLRMDAEQLGGSMNACRDADGWSLAIAVPVVPSVPVVPVVADGTAHSSGSLGTGVARSGVAEAYAARAVEMSFAQRRAPVHVLWTVFAASDVLELCERAASRPSVVLADLEMPGMGGVELAEALSQRQPDIAIVGMTAFELTHELDRVRASGIAQVLHKEAQTELLVRAIGAAADNESAANWCDGDRVIGREVLSETELAVLRLFLRGRTVIAVGHQLHMSEGTVKTHMNAAYRKLSVHNRSQAIAVCIREGLL